MSSRGPIRENIAYSVLDYASQPALMLVATPLLLHHLGAQQYGVWMLVNSITATASGLGGGFGDGATKFVATHRGVGDRAGALQALAAVLAVNSACGLISALAMICLAPWLIGHLFAVHPPLRQIGVLAVQISAALLFVRFIESVCIAAIRGCERYRSTILVSIGGRMLSTAWAVSLAMAGHNLLDILWSGLAVGMMSLAGQVWLTHRLLEAAACWRTLDLKAGFREVSSFGTFTWIKSSLGILTAYGDRLLVAGVLGTGPLAYYALCNQLTQPIPALVASAFNFVFPNFAAHSEASGLRQVYRRYRTANAIVMAATALACTVLVAGSNLILRLWVGSAIAAQYHGLLRLVAIGNCLLALSVVPQYAALAFGRARAMTAVNLLAGALSLPASYFLMRGMGVLGAGFGKVIAGAAFLTAFQVARRAISYQSQRNAAVTADVKAAMDFAG